MTRYKHNKVTVFGNVINLQEINKVFYCLIICFLITCSTHFLMNSYWYSDIRPIDMIKKISAADQHGYIVHKT